MPPAAMARFAAELKSVSLDGEIVEILEEPGGCRVAKVVLSAPVIVEIGHEWLADAHLGDHVVIQGWVAGVDSHKEDV